MARGILLNYRGKKRFFWNVDGHVGPGCANRDEDVQLVQFGFFCMAKNPKGLVRFTAAEQAIVKSVVVGAKYSGGPSDPLTLAIRAHQRMRGGTQDGRVSPIQNLSGTYEGHQTWMIVSLSNQILDANPGQWPMLHRMEKCPPALAEVSRICLEATGFTV